LFLELVTESSNAEGSEMIVLVPHGEDPNKSKDRMIIQREHGQDSPYPCVVSGSGMYEHGQTFSKGGEGSDEENVQIVYSRLEFRQLPLLLQKWDCRGYR